jgi:TolA-binding protein
MNENASEQGASSNSSSMKALADRLEAEERGANTAEQPTDTTKKPKVLPLRMMMQQMQDRQDTMEQEVKTVKGDVETIKLDIASMKQEMEQMKSSMMANQQPQSGVRPAQNNQQNTRRGSSTPPQTDFSRNRLMPDGATSGSKTEETRSNRLEPDNAKQGVADEFGVPVPPKNAKKKVASKPKKRANAKMTKQLKDALILVNKKQFAEAVPLLKQIIQKEESPKTRTTAVYWLGESLYGLGKYAEAIEQFTEVMDDPLSSKADDALILAAESYLKMEDNTQARAHFDKLTKLYPQSEYIAHAKKMLQILPADTQ